MTLPGSLANGTLAGVLSIILLLGLASCSSHSPRPGASTHRSNYHLVRKGETLYSIAWRHGTDYRHLARINRIKPPYTIYAGQKLWLGSRSAVQPRKTRAPAPKKKVSKKPSGSSAPIASNIAWRWPFRGKIIKPFSLDGRVNKGIDIAGKAGMSVRAAAPGVVVYAGGNLRGYGKLVIVKHNAHFLSAYGNNQSIRVREGERVKAGQIIGEVGTSSASVDMLHFEIRRDGKPLDPTRLLPK